MWSDIERTLNRSRIEAIDSIKYARNTPLQGRQVSLELSQADELIAELCPPRNSGALFVRHLLRNLGMDERRLFHYRFEHKLVQAISLHHYAPGVIPVTFGAYRYLEDSNRTQRGEKLDDLYARGYFIKSSLGEASGEVNGFDKRIEFEAFLEQSGSAVELADLTVEQFVVQKRISIAREFRVHSIEGFAIPSLTHDRYDPERRDPELEKKATTFVQSILDRLPPGIIRDTLFGWDIAFDKKGIFIVVEVNSTGIHPVFKPGFQCSGFFQTEAWRVPSLARLLSCIRTEYDVSINIEVPNDLHSDFASTYWLVAHYDHYRGLLEGLPSLQQKSSPFERSSLGRATNRLPAAENTIRWMIADLRSLVTCRERPDSISTPTPSPEIDKASEEVFLTEMLGDVVEPTRAFGADHNSAPLASSSASQPMLDSLVQSILSKADSLAVSPRSLFSLAWARVLASISGSYDVVFLLGIRPLDNVVNADPRRLLLPSRIDISKMPLIKLLQEVDKQHRRIESCRAIDTRTAAACSAVSRDVALTNAVFECFLSEEENATTASISYEPTAAISSVSISIGTQDAVWRIDAETSGGIDAAPLPGYVHTAISSLIQLLDSDPNSSPSEIAVIPEEQLDIFSGWNETRSHGEAGNCILDLIETHSAAAPDAVAVECDEQSLSYKALNLRAEKLAAQLHSEQIQFGDKIGVCCVRSIELIVALLAILKSGATYVPLDPSLPTERLAYIVNDGAIRVVLADSLSEDLVQSLEPRVRMLRLAGKPSESSLDPYERVRVIGQSSLAPAYAMYTSGSTGRPKGVLIPHGGLSNRIEWMQNTYPLTPSDVVLHKTPFGFDVSMWELLWPLISGARLVIAAPQMHMNPEYLVDQIIRREVTVIHFVPPMLQMFLKHQRVSDCRSLRYIFCSGDTLGSSTALECLRVLPNAGLHNLYGPTEASIDVTAWKCRASSVREPVPIGTPIANTRVYILDADLRFVPIGAVGEIYIAGVGLALGYINRPDQTASRFVCDPYSPSPGGRMYRTGDLGRRRPDGALEFLGRDDRQVKIRGNRVELGEIESRLSELQDVTDVVVVAREDLQGDANIHVYYVASQEISTDDLETEVVERMAQHLKRHLPPYMQPLSYIRIESIPITANGKLDNGALPIPFQKPAHNTDLETTETEQAVLELWNELLANVRIDLELPFIALGGDSLKAVRCVNAMRAKFGVEVPLAWLFSREASVRQLASVIDELDVSARPQ